jgi:hypothetical protein
MMIMLLSRLRTEGWWGRRASAVAVRWDCLAPLPLRWRVEEGEGLFVEHGGGGQVDLMVTSRKTWRSSRVCRPCWNLWRMWVKSCCCCCCFAVEVALDDEVEDVVVEVEFVDRRRS